MKETKPERLLEKYRNGTCSPAEQAIVEFYYLNNDLVRQHLSASELELSSQRVIKRSSEILAKKDRVQRLRQKWFAAAASIIILVSIGLLIFTSDTPQPQEHTSDISPGSNKATLALSNGKTINLNDAKTGLIIDVNELTYSDGTPIENIGETTGLQTLSTPKGGQYQLILKDGTKIWLNSASTLTFKTSPSYLATREVSLSGEAYFEIAKDKKRPFRVHTDGQVIEVLGTRFNVTAYKEENITRTTLVEGSVKVNNSIILKPGQQSLNSTGQLMVKEADLSLETAWKSGKIQFEDADLKTVMNILARWYDITPNYEYYPEESRFTGSISRYKNISEVLKLLESTNEVHFKITGRRVTAIK